MIGRSDDLKELTAALAQVQAELEPAAKNASNPHLKNRYADLAAVWDACREPLSRHGLAVVQTTRPSPPEAPDMLVLVTTLLHISGGWISSELAMPLPAANKGPQQVGSALTYARRYGLSAMLGICPEDDDGEAAQPRSRAQHDRQAPQAAPRGQRQAPQAAPLDRIRRIGDRWKAAHPDHADDREAFMAWVRRVTRSKADLSHPANWTDDDFERCQIVLDEEAAAMAEAEGGQP